MAKKAKEKARPGDSVGQAAGKGIPVIGLAGKVPLETDESLQQYFDLLLPINNEPVELSKALLHTRNNLIRTAKVIGDLLALPH